MCTRQRRYADGPTAEGAGRCIGGFPFWALWLIWPAIWLLKGASAAATPLLAAMLQPVALGVSPLPLLLIGAGVAILLLDRARWRD
jgi:hypothetical protein